MEDWNNSENPLILKILILTKWKAGMSKTVLNVKKSYLQPKRTRRHHFLARRRNDDPIGLGIPTCRYEISDPWIEILH